MRNETLPDPYSYPDFIYEVRKSNTTSVSTIHDEIITYRKEKTYYGKASGVYEIGWVRVR